MKPTPASRGACSGNAPLGAVLWELEAFIAVCGVVGGADGHLDCYHRRAPTKHIPPSSGLFTARDTFWVKGR